MYSVDTPIKLDERSFHQLITRSRPVRSKLHGNISYDSLRQLLLVGRNFFQVMFLLQAHCSSHRGGNFWSHKHDNLLPAKRQFKSSKIWKEQTCCLRYTTLSNVQYSLHTLR